MTRTYVGVAVVAVVFGAMVAIGQHRPTSPGSMEVRECVTTEARAVCDLEDARMDALWAERSGR